MKKIFIIYMLFMAVSLYASGKDDYFNNDTNIIANIIIEDPYPSKLKNFWEYINSNSTYKVFYRIDSNNKYWYVVSILEAKNGETIDNIFAEASKTTGTATSLAKNIGLDYSDAVFKTATEETQ